MTTPTPLTDDELFNAVRHLYNYEDVCSAAIAISKDEYRAIESEVNARWQKMLAGQEPVGTVQCIRGVTIGYLNKRLPVDALLYTHPAPDHTALLQDVVRVLEENWSSSAKMLTGKTITLPDDAAECVRKQVDIYNRIKEVLK